MNSTTHCLVKLSSEGLTCSSVGLKSRPGIDRQKCWLGDFGSESLNFGIACFLWVPQIRA